MPKLNLKELFEAQLKDAENKDDILNSLKLDDVQRTIDEQYVNPIVKKTREETLEKAKSEVRESAIDEFIKSLKVDGVENSDAFKAYTKRLQATTEEKDEIITKYEKELNEIKPKFQETMSQLEKRDALDKVLGAGFNRKYAEDVYTIAKNKASDDTPLEKVLDGMKSEYKMFLDKPGDSGSYHKDDGGSGGEDDKELEAKWRKEAGLT